LRERTSKIGGIKSCTDFHFVVAHDSGVGSVNSITVRSLGVVVNALATVGKTSDTGAWEQRTPIGTGETADERVRKAHRAEDIRC
jgi:hypothetical protein